MDQGTAQTEHLGTAKADQRSAQIQNTLGQPKLIKGQLKLEHLGTAKADQRSAQTEHLGTAKADQRSAQN